MGFTIDKFENPCLKLHIRGSFLQVGQRRYLSLTSAQLGILKLWPWEIPSIHLAQTNECSAVLSHFSCIQLFTALWTVPARLLCPWDSPGKNTGVGCHTLLQGIFPTQGSNLCLLSPALAGVPIEQWNGFPCPTPGDLLNPGIKPASPALQVDSLLLSHQGSPWISHQISGLP